MLSEIALLFIFLSQPPEPLKSQGLRGRLLAFDQFQTFSLWSRSQTSNLWRYSYLFSCLVNYSLVRSVAIRPLLDELLALSQSDRARMSCSTSVNGCLRLCLFTTSVLCVTVLDCLRLHRVVVCQVYRAIMHDFGGSVGWPVGFCSCKLFSTIGSSNCKRSKTKSIYK